VTSMMHLAPPLGCHHEGVYEDDGDGPLQAVQQGLTLVFFFSST